MKVPPVLGHNPDGLTVKFFQKYPYKIKIKPQTIKPPLHPTELTVTEV